MAQPPGSDTRASPQRANSGPSTRIDARMVFTRSYGASGSVTRSARSSTPRRSSSDTCTPMRPSSPIMVVTSFRWGRFDNRMGSVVRSEAHISGNAAFLAPDTRTSPDNGAPPWMTSLSTLGLEFLGGEGLHGQRVNLLAHPLAEHAVYQLVPLDPALAAKQGTHDERLEVLPVARHLKQRALQVLLDIAPDLLRRHHFCSLFPIRYPKRPPNTSACSHSSAKRAPPPIRPRDNRRPRRSSCPGPR